MSECTHMRCQLAGPVSGMARRAALAMFDEAQRALERAGAASVWSPVRNVGSRTPWELAMRRCIRHLTGSCGPEMLVTLPGWESSAGAALEVAVARACGVRVVSVEEAVR